MFKHTSIVSPLRTICVVGTLVGTLAGALLACPTRALARPIQQSIPAKQALDVQAVSTDIKIVGAQTDMITVRGELPDDWKLELQNRGERTQIDVSPGKRSRRSSRTATLTITVPLGSSVRAKTVSGDVDISHVSGNLELASVSGDIRAGSGGAEAKLKTVSGDILVASNSARLHVKSVSGDIEVTGARGVFEAKTISGEVHVSNATLTRADLTSTSGDVWFEGALTLAGPHQFKSHSGDLELVLQRGKPVDISASSRSGSVEDRFHKRHYKGRDTPRFSLGSGGPSVELRTFSGDVTIRPH
ncbi:MAG: DUF4097 family beta strand repeat-containing protein [Nannocystaceae bacterium]